MARIEVHCVFAIDVPLDENDREGLYAAGGQFLGGMAEEVDAESDRDVRITVKTDNSFVRVDGKMRNAASCMEAAKNAAQD